MACLSFFYQRHLMTWRFTALAICLMGCQKSPSAAATSTETADPPGVPVVTSETPLWPVGGGWQIDSTPITVIGADETDPQQQWQWVEAAVRLSNGNVAIGTMGSLRLFSPEGKFIRALSQSGDGPGELRQVQGLVALPGDSLRANDYMGYRVVTYSPDGTLVRDERLDLERFQSLGRWGECDSGIFPDGSRFGCLPDSTIAPSATNRPNVVISEGHTSPGPGLLRQLRRIYIATPALDATYPLGIGGSGEQFGVSIAQGEAFVSHPFHSRPKIAAGGTPMRIAIATNPEYRIEVWTPTGVLERIIRRTSGRRAPTAIERDSARVFMLRYLPGMESSIQEKVLAAVPTPDSLPAVAAMAVTPNGELIVQREGDVAPQVVSVWDVFDASGRWLGEFRLPIRSRVLSVGTDHIVVRRYTEDDATHIEVYQWRRG